VPLADADYVLCTGLLDDETETAETYRSLLETARMRALKLYCANPDLVVERGEQLVPCAGAIAELYEALGDDVVWVGKPRPLVYRIAAEKVAEALGRKVEADRILCIGDALRTDIAGANRAGHQSIMTLAGIHAHQIGLGADGAFDRQKLELLAQKAGARPSMIMQSLVW
jgi:HAD superfamily hydrolase (TIGR01459 family)